MQNMSEFAEEQAYTAKVQRMLLAIIERADNLSGSHLDSIRAIIADAWEELRLRPTELSVQEMEQLSSEVDRFAARRDFAINQSEHYRRMLMDPFFARVDFAEHGTDNTEKIVIGLYGLNNEQGELLVHDWRAPICSLYYDCVPGEAYYDCPEGRIAGTVTLKRQYKMKKGQLCYYVDTSVSIEDDMLLELLSADSGRYMKQIAATIQSEQNAAVRCENEKVVCVVGGAGSGKTSVAMHRAAYLMYHRRDTLDADKIMIISPGQAFSEYISDVLPELGERNIRSGMLSDIVEETLGRKVESVASRTEQLLGSAGKLRKKSVAYKSTMQFLTRIRGAAENYTHLGPKFSNILSDNKVLIGRGELQKMYRHELGVLSPAQRLERMRIALDTRIDSWRESLERQYERSYSGKYTGRALLMAVQMAVTRQLQPVREQIRRNMDVTGVSLYREIIDNTPDELREAFWDNCRAGIVWWEDAVAEAYLMLKLGFAPQEKHIYHLLIDEAQDYSETELALLHAKYPNAHITILGDPRQRTCPAMPPCDPQNWSKCFEVESAPVFELMNCYRSTRQITAFCNKLLPADEKEMTPYGRDGAPVQVAQTDIEAIRAQLSALREQGTATIAVLTRTRAAADALSEQLENVYRLDGGKEDLNYEVTDNVVACYHLVKGMEFDAVLVVWPDAELTDGERRRLYTACSRALHSVTVFTEGTLLNTLGGCI